MLTNCDEEPFQYAMMYCPYKKKLKVTNATSVTLHNTASAPHTMPTHFATGIFLSMVALKSEREKGRSQRVGRSVESRYRERR